MSTPDYDWSRFTCKINIAASLENIYAAWTVPHHIERWFVRQASFTAKDKSFRDALAHISEGDKYHWLWHGHSDEAFEEGKVLEANGSDLLRFSFLKGALVTVQIGEAMGENIVLLTQEKIPTDEFSRVHYHMGCMQGWSFYLANLKSFLEGGIDLRNKNQALAKMVNA